MERMGNGLAAGERERVCERQRVAENGVGVCSKNGLLEEGLTGISREPNVSMENVRQVVARTVPSVS